MLYIYTFLLGILSIGLSDTNDKLRRAYIEQHRELAILEMKRTGIPASIILGQAALESNFGQGRLAKHANNHFGIKCKSYWTGLTYYLPDDDYDQTGQLMDSCFRMYNSAMDSFIDHSYFLLHHGSYHELLDEAGSDYKQWAKGLAGKGYASDKKYASKLVRIIETYQLHHHD